MTKYVILLKCYIWKDYEYTGNLWVVDSNKLLGENLLIKYINFFTLNFTTKGVVVIMKAKKLVSLALPVMLLSGCITIETDGKKANEPKKEENTTGRERK